MAEEKGKLSIVYEKKEDKPTIAVTGAYGGPTPDGTSVVMHVFIEHFSVPNITTHDIEQGGRVDLSKGDTVKRGDATREIQATLVMSPETAFLLSRWLDEKAKSALSRRDHHHKGGEPPEEG